MGRVQVSSAEHLVPQQPQPKPTTKGIEAEYLGTAITLVLVFGQSSQSVIAKSHLVSNTTEELTL